LGGRSPPKPSRGRAMFTSDGHAAAPHNAAMTMGRLWEGRPLPGPPPLGEGTGRLPAGRGSVRQAHRRWGNLVSPYFHLRHPCGCAAQRRDDHGASLGGPPPPWPSPAGGGNRAPPRREGFGSTGSPQVGKPGFPMSQPLLRAPGAPAGRGSVRQAHRRWGNPVSPYVHLSGRSSRVGSYSENNSSTGARRSEPVGQRLRQARSAKPWQRSHLSARRAAGAG